MTDTTGERSRTLDVARAYLDRGLPERALSTLEGLLRERPDDGEAWLLVARAHLAAGRSALACEAADSAVRHAPWSDHALRVLALARLTSGDGAAARAAAGQAVAARPLVAWNHGVLALALIGADRAGAEREAAAAVALDPLDADLHVVHARTALGRRRVRVARERLAAALELDPTNAQALRILAELDVTTGGAAAQARGLGLQLGQVRDAPADRNAVANLELMARQVLARSNAVVAVGALLAFRVDDAASGRHGAVAAVCVASVLVAVGLATRTVLAADAATRRLLLGLLRVPLLALALALTVAALLLQLTAAAVPDASAPLGLAAAACLLSWLVTKVERDRVLRRHGRPVPPTISRWTLLTLAVVFLVAAVCLGVLATSPERDPNPVPLAVTAAVLAGIGAALGRSWWRRRSPGSGSGSGHAVRGRRR